MCRVFHSEPSSARWVGFSHGLVEGWEPNPLVLQIFSKQGTEMNLLSTLVCILNDALDRIPTKIERRFFLTHPLQSKSDCETFLPGWFHAAGSVRGSGRSEVQSRENNSSPRSQRDVPEVLGKDAVSKGLWDHGRMGAGPICLVLPEMPINNAGWIDHSGRPNLGRSDEGGRKAEDQQVSRCRTSAGDRKEVSPGRTTGLTWSAFCPANPKESTG